MARASRSGAAERAYAKRTQRASVRASGPLPQRGSLVARIPFVAIVIGLLAVGLAVTLMLTTKAAEDSYRLSAAKEHNQELVEQKAALERDVRSANSAPELARKAAEQGMIPAKDVARIVVADDGTTTVVGEPTAAVGAPVAAPAPTPAPAAATAPGTPRGAGVAVVNLPPVAGRATADLQPIAPRNTTAAPAPAPAAAPVPVNAAQPAPGNGQSGTVAGEHE